MGNTTKHKIKRIFEISKKLPFFNFNTLSPIEDNRRYLKVMMGRAAKSDKTIRLKKGVYVTKSYLDDLRINQKFSFYLEFLANNLYQPSYLSVEYILYENNILSDVPANYTSVTTNKTMHFTNTLGDFFYHKIKNELFVGFFIKKENNYLIAKATKAKALFDFLYLRKNILINKRSVQELRLNLGVIAEKDKKEFNRYIKIEKSYKMSQISHWLFE